MTSFSSSPSTTSLLSPPSIPLCVPHCDSRDLCVTVRIRGRDPHRLKTRRALYFTTQHGYTTLQCSGTLYRQEENDRIMVVTSAHHIRAFLRETNHRYRYHRRHHHHHHHHHHRPEGGDHSHEHLVEGTEVDVWLGEHAEQQHHQLQGQGGGKGSEVPQRWWPCHLVRLGVVEEASTSFRHLLSANAHDFIAGYARSPPPASITQECKHERVLTPLAADNSYADPQDQLQEESNMDLSSQICEIAVLEVLMSPDEQRQLKSTLPMNYAFANVVPLCAPLNVISSPFALLSTAVFHRTLTQGIVSHTPSPSLFLIDARCLPGSEGAPVIAHCQISTLIGIVLPPLLHRDSSQVIALTPALSASALFCWLSSSPLTAPSASHHSRALLSGQRNILATTHDNALSLSDTSQLDGFCWQPAFNASAVAIIKNSWATAVLVHPKMLLTNAHFVRPFMKTFNIASSDASPSLEAEIVIRFPFVRSTVPAKLVYVCANWDLACLELMQARINLQPLVLNSVCPCPGADVMAVGFPLFAPHSDISPTITRGVLCQVVRCQSEVVMLQSSAHIHNGNSGGALVDVQGKCVGLISCNIALKPDWPYIKQDRSIKESHNFEDSQAFIVPSVSLSIPSMVLNHVLTAYVHQSFAGQYIAFDRPNAAFSAIWNLSDTTEWALPPPRVGTGRYEQFMNQLQHEDEVSMQQHSRIAKL